MILITGGAGFIGSNLQAALARRGLETIVVDTLGCKGKWLNLASHAPDRIIHPDALDAFLETRPASGNGVSYGSGQQHVGHRR
jgi:ADP-L-glycero-D-manno-heptose 6-epimerase